MIRVLFYINFREAKELRRALRNVRRTVPDVLNVFILFFTSLFVFSFLGWRSFKNQLVYFQYFFSNKISIISFIC